MYDRTLRLALVAICLLLPVGCATTRGPDGHALLAQGKAEQAENWFRAQLRVTPDVASYRDGLGAALAAQERFRQACPLLGPQSKPLSAGECWVRAARLASDAGKWGLVLSYFRQANTKGWQEEEAVTFFQIVAEAAREEVDWGVLIEVYPRQLAFHPSDAEFDRLFGLVRHRSCL